MSAFVLAGLPTTSTRTSFDATLAIDAPWPVKIGPFALSRSQRLTLPEISTRAGSPAPPPPAPRPA